jgi:Mor family transcriptional regulator
MIRADRDIRDNKILNDLERGVDIRRVALKYDLTVTRIQQIVNARTPKPSPKRRKRRRALTQQVAAS